MLVDRRLRESRFVLGWPAEEFSSVCGEQSCVGLRGSRRQLNQCVSTFGHRFGERCGIQGLGAEHHNAGCTVTGARAMLGGALRQLARRGILNRERMLDLTGRECMWS